VNILSQLEYLYRKKKEVRCRWKDFTNTLFALELQKVSAQHIKFVGFLVFKHSIESKKFKDKKVKVHLTNLCLLNGITMLLKDSSHCFSSGYFMPGVPYSDLLTEANKMLLTALRP